MHVVVRFKNRHILYIYLLFLFIVGSCTMGSGNSPDDDENIIEEVDEDKSEDSEKSDRPDQSDESEKSDDYDLSDESELSDDYDLSDTSDQSEQSDEDSVTYPDISGTWAKIMVFFGKAKPPIVSPPVAWAINILRTKIEQNGAEITTHNSMCRLKVGNDNAMLQAVMPDTYADALPAVTKTARLNWENDGTFSFRQEKVWDVRSCVLDDPEDDLPTEIDDPRVEDWDNNGIKGLRMGSSGVVNGWAEIVQKVSTILDGTVQENGEIHGLVTWAERQKVLWTDNFAMSQGSPTYQDGDPAKSIFIYRRIDSNWDCQTIRQKSAEIFPVIAAQYPDEFK